MQINGLRWSAPSKTRLFKLPLSYPTTSGQDAAAQERANSWDGTTYTVVGHNCVQMLGDALDAADQAHGKSFIPNENFKQSKAIGNATPSQVTPNTQGNPSE